MTAGPVWAVVVAGGSGSRFGRPKQFEELGGRPVATWAVAAARAVAEGVVLVLPPDRITPGAEAPFGADVAVPGGATRSASVRQGLAAVPRTAAIVVVHDAARPLAGPDLFRAVVTALDEPAGSPGEGPGRPGDRAVEVAGAICAVPVADTLKRVADDGVTVVGTVERDGMVAVQTPQAFRADALRRAHAGGGDATDDAGLVEAMGGVVRVVAGDPCNLKLTTPSDLVYAEHLLAGVW